jgi:hypothetical protein
MQSSNGPPSSEAAGRTIAERPWLAASVLAVAVCLRLRGLSSFPFEQDELYTLIESTQLFNSPLKPGIEARPLYYFIQHALLAMGPATPLTARLLPFLFGIAGVWTTWYLGVSLFGPIAGWVAGLLVACSPWHIYASGFARYWSLVYLLAALFYLFLARSYLTDRASHHAGAAVAGILGSLTHPTFLFPLTGAALAVTVFRADGTVGWRWPSRSAWRWLWVPWATALLLLYLALKATGHSGAIENFQGRGMEATLRLVPAMVQWMTPTICATGLLGMLILIGQSERASWRQFGAIALLGSASGTILLLAAATRTDVYADYGMAMLPLFFVASGGVIAFVAGHLRKGSGLFAVGATVVILAGTLPSTLSHLSQGTRFDYRPALAKIQAIAPSVPVLSWPVVISRHYAPDLNIAELRLTAGALDTALAARGDLWLVLSYREYGLVGDATGEGAAWADSHCRRIETTRGLRIDSRMYEVVLSRCSNGF